MVEKHTKGETSWIRWTVLGLLALVSLCLLLGGGFLWAAAVSSWASHDYTFQGWQMIDWAIGIVGAAGIAAGCFIAGFFFRFLPWRHAPLASLVLAVISAGFLMATFAIFSRTGHGEDSIEVLLLQVLTIAGLPVLALPPFLHWLRAAPAVPALDATGRNGA